MNRFNSNKNEKKQPKLCFSEQKKLLLYFFSSIILTVLTSVFGAYSVLLSQGEGSRYFADAWATHALTITLVSSIALSLSAIFVFRTDNKAILGIKSKGLRFFELLSAVSAALCAYFILTRHQENVLIQAETVSEAILSALYAATGVSAAILSAAYAAAILSDRAPAKIIKSYAEILFCIFIITSLYLDLTIELNSPYKLLIQFAAASVILAALADARQELSSCALKLLIPARLIEITLCALCAAVNITAFVQGAPIYDQDYLFFSVFFAAKAICGIIKYININYQKNASI